MNTKILPSEIHGLGLFANRTIEIGDIIVQPEKINLNEDIDKWIRYNKSRKEKSFAYLNGYCLVNHSKHPNTKRNEDFDIVAIRPILSGQEITECYYELPDEENPFINTIEYDIFRSMSGV